jgi:3-phenylpropionate/trans-cinnamate dioxygenase ferredoxin subunit
VSKPHRVCSVRDLPPGQRRIVEIGGRSIGVFNIDGSFHAIRNVCPHQLAPLCLGPVSGTTLPSKPNEFNYGLEGRIIRCPWHGWEFDITTGQSVFNPHKVRVKSYEVTVEKTPGGERRTCTIDADAEDPSVEKYEVTIEDEWVVVHV